MKKLMIVVMVAVLALFCFVGCDQDSPNIPEKNPINLHGAPFPEEWLNRTPYESVRVDIPRENNISTNVETGSEQYYIKENILHVLSFPKRDDRYETSYWTYSMYTLTGDANDPAYDRYDESNPIISYELEVETYIGPQSTNPMAYGNKDQKYGLAYRIVGVVDNKTEEKLSEEAAAGYLGWILPFEKDSELTFSLTNNFIYRTNPQQGWDGELTYLSATEYAICYPYYLSQMGYLGTGEDLFDSQYEGWDIANNLSSIGLIAGEDGVWKTSI